MNDVTDAGILTTASDLLFSGGREGYFYALDARNGELLWKTSVGGARRFRPDDLLGGRQAIRRGFRRQFAVRLRAAGIEFADLVQDLFGVRVRVYRSRCAPKPGLRHRCACPQPTGSLSSQGICSRVLFTLAHRNEIR